MNIERYFGHKYIIKHMPFIAFQKISENDCLTLEQDYIEHCGKNLEWVSDELWEYILVNSQKIMSSEYLDKFDPNNESRDDDDYVLQSTKYYLELRMPALSILDIQDEDDKIKNSLNDKTIIFIVNLIRDVTHAEHPVVSDQEKENVNAVLNDILDKCVGSEYQIVLKMQTIGEELTKYLNSVVKRVNLHYSRDVSDVVYNIYVLQDTFNSIMEVINRAKFLGIEVTLKTKPTTEELVEFTGELDLMKAYLDNVVQIINKKYSDDHDKNHNAKTKVFSEHIMEFLKIFNLEGFNKINIEKERQRQERIAKEKEESGLNEKQKLIKQLSNDYCSFNN